jgi:endonuclease/exonuclease/phosphatase family metal-dependent hydrolase
MKASLLPKKKPSLRQAVLNILKAQNVIHKNKSKKIGRFNWFLLLLNGFALFALLLSYLAPHIHPKYFWPLSFFAMAYFPILLLNLLFIVLWAVRKPLYALLSLVPILLGWNILRDHFGFSPTIENERVLQPKEDELRLMSYNAHLFSEPDFDVKAFGLQDDVLATIGSVNPDVVCIQEFHTRFKGKNHIAQRMKEDLNMPYHYFFPISINEEQGYGMAIFSKYPIVGTGHIPDHAYSINQMIYADIEWKDKVFRVYSVHLRSIGFDEDEYNYVRNQRLDLDYNIKGIKSLTRRVKNAFSHRAEQAKALYNHTQQYDQPYIVVGDFNDTPLSYSFNMISQDMKNSFREKGRGWGTTYNGEFPNFQIDFILVRPDIQVHRYQIIKRKVSDHYPIWVDLSLVPSETIKEDAMEVSE